MLEVGGRSRPQPRGNTRGGQEGRRQASMWLNLPEGRDLVAIRPGGTHFSLWDKTAKVGRSGPFSREASGTCSGTQGWGGPDPLGRAASRLQQQAASAR